MQIKKIKATEVRLEEPIAVILETQEEIDQLFAVLGYASIGEAIEKDNNDWCKVWDYLCTYKSVNYIKWHEKLKEILI